MDKNEIVKHMLERQGKPLGEGFSPGLKKMLHRMATPSLPPSQEKIDEIRLADQEFADHLQRLVDHHSGYANAPELD